MPKTLSPSDRMQVRNIGELMHPGACCVCGSGTCQQGYIDIGVYYDYEGQMYLCMTCLTEAAETAGMLSLEESEHLIEQNKQLAAELTDLTATNKELSEQNEQFNNLLRPLAERSVADRLISISVPSDSPTDEGQGDETVTDESVSKRESDESVVTESATEPVRLRRATRTTSSNLKL